MQPKIQVFKTTRISERVKNKSYSIVPVKEPEVVLINVNDSNNRRYISTREINKSKTDVINKAYQGLFDLKPGATLIWIEVDFDVFNKITTSGSSRLYDNIWYTSIPDKFNHVYIVIETEIGDDVRKWSNAGLEGIVCNNSGLTDQIRDIFDDILTGCVPVKVGTKYEYYDFILFLPNKVNELLITN